MEKNSEWSVAFLKWQKSFRPASHVTSFRREEMSFFSGWSAALESQRRVGTEAVREQGSHNSGMVKCLCDFRPCNYQKGYEMIFRPNCPVHGQIQ